MSHERMMDAIDCRWLPLLDEACMSYVDYPAGWFSSFIFRTLALMIKLHLEAQDPLASSMNQLRGTYDAVARR